MRYVATGLAMLLTLSFATPGAAAESEPVFTGTGKTCADITWKPSALARFPNIGAVCQALVERNGKQYAQFNGVVQRRSGNSLYIRFQGGEQVSGGDRAVLIKPPEDMVIQTPKGKLRMRDAQRGQELTVYIPSDHFVVNLGDEIGEVDQTPIEDVVALTEEPTPAEPPRAAEASPPPVEAPAPQATPPAPPPVAAVPAPAPQAPKESPWTLLILGVVIAVIVIGVLTMRYRSK
jgi:hypothetical protein